MNELSPEARRILGLARRGDELLETDRARLDQRMARRLALAAGVTGTTLGTAKIATGAAAMSTLLGKGIVTGTLVVAAVTGTWKAAERLVAHHHTAPVAVVVSAPTLAGAPTQASRSPQLSAEAAPLLDDAAATAPSAQRDMAAPNQPKKSQLRGAPRTESETNATQPSSDGVSDPLQAEATALREAQQAMSQGHADRALRLIGEQDKRFSGGALAQERAAASIFALCNLGRAAEAREKAAAFERRWPKSPLISRVRRACDADVAK